MTKRLMEISDSFLFNKSPHTHTLTHQSLALLPAARQHLPAAPSSGSLWTPVNTCRNIGLTRVHPSHIHKCSHIRMITTASTLLTIIIHYRSEKTELYSVASDKRKK